MSKKEELKKLLADKYDKKKEDLTDSTSISDIIGGDKKLAGYIKDKFEVELSNSDLEGASDINDLANLL
jgi:acyl carrier protein